MTEHDFVKPPPNVDKLFLNTTLQCNDGLLKQKKIAVLFRLLSLIYV